MALRWLLAAAAAAAGSAVDVAETGPESIHVRGDLWHKWVLNSDDVWAIAILERDAVCGEACEKIRNELTAVNQKAQGIVRLGWTIAHDAVPTMDGDEIPVRQVFNITTIPHLVIFNAGPKRLDMAMKLGPEGSSQFLFQGQRMLFENLKQFVPSIADTVRAKYMEDFLTKEAPTLPRVLLLSKAVAAHGSAVWKRAGLDFASRAVFGHALLDVEDGALAAAFGVDKASLPANQSSVVLVSGPGPHKVAGTMNAKGLPGPNSYAGWARFPGTGGMTYPTLKAWLETVLPMPTVPQLTSQGMFDRHCGNAATGGVCFIALLPPGAEEAAADAEEQMADGKTIDSKLLPPLTALRRVAAMNLIRADYNSLGGGSFVATRLPATFSWVDAEQQPDFAAAFRLPAPALIALNPRKKLYAPLKLSFNEPNLRSFVDAMMEQSNPARIAAKASVSGRVMQSAEAALQEASAETFKKIQPDISDLISLEPLQGGSVPTLRTQVSREALEAALGGIKGGSKGPAKAKASTSTGSTGDKAKGTGTAKKAAKASATPKAEL